MIRTEQETTVTCRAKINLTLDVLDRRPDGYHNLESVMQSVDVADVLHVRSAPGNAIKIAANVPGIPSGPSNTVYKACALFKDAAEIDCALAVEIDKRIPVEAGLGGGSTNAAAVLLALNDMFDSILTLDELIAVAARVGSDVPYFILGGTVLVTGRGETIEPMDDAPVLDLVIAKPETGVSTAWAYGRLAAIARRKSLAGTPRMIEAVRSGDRKQVVEALSNDFDAPVCESYPPIAELKRVMTELGAEATLLCGSGAGVFGVFDGEASAESAAEVLKSRCPYAVATKTSPIAVTFGDPDAD